MAVTDIRASTTLRARTKPRSGARRTAGRVALGVVLLLNGLCLLCWPAVVEFVGSYR